MKELIPSILNANTSLKQEKKKKKDTGKFFSKRKISLHRVSTTNGHWLLTVWEKNIYLSIRFQSCRKRCLRTHTFA